MKKYLATKAVSRVSGDIAGSLGMTATSGFAGTAAKGDLKVYFAVKPQELKDVTIHSVCMNKDYTATLENTTLAAGKFYNINQAMTFAVPMGNVSAADAVLVIMPWQTEHSSRVMPPLPMKKRRTWRVLSFGQPNNRPKPN